MHRYDRWEFFSIWELDAIHQLISSLICNSNQFLFYLAQYQKHILYKTEYRILLAGNAFDGSIELRSNVKK
jgi:hypothetical protein